MQTRELLYADRPAVTRYPGGGEERGAHAGPVGHARSAAEDLALITAAASVRLADPKAEHTRLTVLGATFEVARAASDAMHQWASQCLAEYRGSHTAWDLTATGSALAMALERYEAWIPHAVAELRALIPELAAPQTGEAAD